MMGSPILVLLGLIFGLVLLALIVAFVLIPLIKVIGWLVANVLRGIGWFILHIFNFVGGMCTDTIRFIGSVIALVVLVPLMLLNVVIGRWSAAGHFSRSMKRECRISTACLYRIGLQRPLRLLLLGGLLEGVEQRVGADMLESPRADKPSRRSGQFDGYAIVGSLAGGGSGAKLYIAEPDQHKRANIRNMPDRVVIKSFALEDGTSLPQIVRESRALEAAKQLGLVLEHGMDDTRFFYIMPYHEGDHLGVITRQIHAESDGAGLSQQRLSQALSYVSELASTLSTYHKGGLWHKDVKPENVIVHDGRAHLVDLGLVTPLRSAMTLTTHGTEYFRDPELVRQALRGVKVHQVDGAKFDIYAVGAVLYFVIENTFPAHGGLSRFVKKSPEALRTIVRRAMVDYHQRYETMDDMLADLQVVASAPDPFAVKPASLPSMRGDDIEEALAELEREDAYAVSAAAHTPVPPAQANPFLDPQRDDVQPSDAAMSPRPQITVTNWWTGAYKATMPAAAQVPLPGAPTPRAAQQQAVWTGKRPAAREQLRTARSRAAEARKRAQAHRRKVRPAPGPTPFVAGVTFIAILAIGATIFGFYKVGQERKNADARQHWIQTQTAQIVPQPAAAPGVYETDPGHPYLLVVDSSNHAIPGNEVQKIVRNYDRSYNVIQAASIVEEEGVIPLIHSWSDDPDGPADDELEAFLEQHNLTGFIYVHAEESSGANPKVKHTRIYSQQDDARYRRWPKLDTVPSAPLKPVLLVNDHPVKSDPKVEKAVKQIVQQHRALGWTIIEQDDLEFVVRRVMPTEADAVPSPLLSFVLHEHELAGVLRISTLAGEGPPQDRVTFSFIAPDEVDEDVEAPDHAEVKQRSDACWQPGVGGFGVTVAVAVD